jgi:hypothetical protein
MYLVVNGGSEGKELETIIRGNAATNECCDGKGRTERTGDADPPKRYETRDMTSNMIRLDLLPGLEPHKTTVIHESGEN